MKLGIELSKALKTDVSESGLLDVGEFAFDRLVQEGAFRELPILGTIIGIRKTGAAISDYIFARKLISFLAITQETTKEQRKKIIEQIDEDKRYRIKVGEKLIFILDKCEDSLNAELVGWFFNAFIQEQIDYATFKNGAYILSRIPLESFWQFMETSNDGGDTQGSEGLFEFGLYIPHAKDLSITYDSEYGDITHKGGDVVALETLIGSILRKVFKDYPFDQPVESPKA